MAESALESKYREIYLKIPEIRELERLIAKTNSELIKFVVGNMGEGGDIDSKFEQIRDKNLGAQAMIDDLLLKNGYPKDFLTAAYTCKKCEDAGIFEGRRCSCFEEICRRLSVNRLNRSANMPDCDFEHFSLSYYRDIKIAGVDCYQVMSGIYDYCRAYADDFGGYSDNLLFYGATGLGKTHLSIAIAKAVALKGYTAAYGSLLNFLHMIESEHFGKTEAEGGGTLRSLLDVELLILDDLGSEFQTNFYESVIYNLINTRLNLSRPTIISTNLTQTEMKNRYNSRIISRLFGGYQTFCFLGEDIRLKRVES